jgi:hypothetical protein
MKQTREAHPARMPEFTSSPARTNPAASLVVASRSERTAALTMDRPDREIADELGRSVKGVHRVAMTLGCVGTEQ